MQHVFIVTLHKVKLNIVASKITNKYYRRAMRTAWVHSGVDVASIQTFYTSLFVMKVSINYNST